MPVGGRKTPFSGKKKKEQLKAKRDQKTRTQSTHKSGNDPRLAEGKSNRSNSVSLDETSKLPLEPNTGGKESNFRKQRYALLFQQLTPEQIFEMKQSTKEALQYLGEESLIFTPDDIPNLPFPKRPFWDLSWSKKQLEEAEAKYFRIFIDKLLKDFPNISYFEMNLETWRQLWRVFEKSDILLLIADIRYPLIHVPIALIEHIRALNKQLVIVLNKIDLVSPELVAHWIHYLEAEYSGIKCVPFASYAGCKTLGHGRRGKLHAPIDSCLALLTAIKQIVQENKIEADLTSWEAKIIEDGKIEESEEFSQAMSSKDEEGEPSCHSSKFLTIGMVGHPNVGKSSVLNALIGKKVVSVSRTPGHTKYFQTYFLTKNLRLCDSPGIVFPTVHPRELQVISGSFPISQLRVPLTVVQYVAEHVPVQKLLKLEKIEKDVVDWSTYEICQSFAEQRGYMTAMAGRPDVNRAANQILRMALDGRTICVAFKPPQNRIYDIDQALLNSIKKLQGENITEETDEDWISSEDNDSDEEHDVEGHDRNDEESSMSSAKNVARVSNKFAMLTAGDSSDESDVE